MKKAILFFAFSFVLGAIAANAQSCQGSAAGKSCCANKVAKAAAADPSIEKRNNADGSVAYVRKQADASGNVQFVSVQFDEATSTFVNVAPKVAPADANSMTKKSCAASATTGGKACCNSGATATKACCASKSAGTGSSCSEKKAEQ